MKKISLILCSATGCLVSVCGLFALEPDARIAPEYFVPVFRSGFEPDSRVVPLRSGNDDIVGTDRSVAPPNDWDAQDKDRFFLWKGFYYEGGDTTMRTARIVPDPVDPRNSVLRFLLRTGNVGVNYERGVGRPKARIQASFTAGEGTDELYQSVRMYFAPHMRIMADMEQSVSWLTIMEWWNNKPGRGNEYIFRISLGLTKKEGAGQSVFFRVAAQNFRYDPIEVTRKTGKSGKFTDRWRVIRDNYPVPFGQWMTIEYYIKKGDKQTGRFYLTVTPDGGEKTVLFDITGDTYGLGNPSPRGVVASFNPMKVYTSGELADRMNNQDAPLDIYWDDLRIYRGKLPGEP